jgi:putative drug exporter of the RND superfamily
MKRGSRWPAAPEGSIVLVTARPSRRLLVVAGWLVAAAALLPAAVRAPERLRVEARILGSESADVDEALEHRFGSPFATSALLVLAGLSGPETPDGRAVLRETVATLQAARGVRATLSSLDHADPLLAGRGGSLVVVGLDPTVDRVDRLVPELRVVTAGLEERLRARTPGLRLSLTGEGPINYDIWRTSADDAARAERRTLPLTLVLLTLAFGAVAAATLPVVSGALAVSLSLGIVSLAAGWLPLAILVLNVVSMLGLALGIDYALLTVSRFREARDAGEPPAAAAGTAARQAGATIALSGLPVAIGFLALLLVPLNELRSAAAGGLVVTFVSVLLAATLLPVLLAWLGPRLEAGRLRRRNPEAERAHYRRWARFVVARPRLVLALALPPLLVLAAQAVRLNPAEPQGSWLPVQTESARAERDLASMGRRGALDALRVVVSLPDEVQALSIEGWEASQRLAAAIAADPRVAAVRSLRSLLGPRSSLDAAAELREAALAPAVAKRSFLSQEGDAFLLEVIPREELDGRARTLLVRDLRRLDAAARSGLAGVRLAVGGLPAFGADYEAAGQGRLGGIATAVVLATLAGLFVGFRSLLVPVKAVLLNLLSVAAAFGALVVVFQDGHGARLVGLAGPTGGVFPIVPALVFCAVFGLSMDYEVFLVARVREERLAGRDEEDAIVEGVAHTGPVITHAALVMIAVFASFVLGGFVVMKMLGLALSVAVLLDATLIRLAVGPALLRLAGSYNWWPGSQARSNTSSSASAVP